MNSWPTIRLKYVLARNDGGVWGDDPTGEGDTVVLRSTEQTVDGSWRVEGPAKRSLPWESAATTRLEVDDLLVTKTSGSARHIGKTSLVTKEVAALSPSFGNFMQRLRVNAEADPRYIWRLLNLPLIRDQFNLMSTSSTGLANLTRDVIDRVEIPWWPLSTQRSIADYLDRETTQIDTLVQEQQRLIDLLRERRQAEIDSALASVAAPAGQLRRAITFLTSGSRGWGEFYAETGDRFVRIGNLARGSLGLRGKVQYIELPPDVTEGSRTRLCGGDLLFSITAYLGSVGVVDSEWCDAYVSQHVALCRLDRDVLLPEFIGWVMLSTAGQDQLKTGAAGGTKVQLALDDIRGLRVPFPPVSEQAGVARRVQDQVAKLDNLIAEAERFIELSKERRSALITAAVTGQIDVREAA